MAECCRAAASALWFVLGLLYIVTDYVRCFQRLHAGFSVCMYCNCHVKLTHKSEVKESRLLVSFQSINNTVTLAVVRVTCVIPTQSKSRLLLFFVILYNHYFIFLSS